MNEFLSIILFAIIAIVGGALESRAGRSKRKSRVAPGAPRIPRQRFVAESPVTVERPRVSTPPVLPFVEGQRVTATPGSAPSVRAAVATDSSAVASGRAAHYSRWRRAFIASEIFNPKYH